MSEISYRPGAQTNEDETLSAASGQTASLLAAMLLVFVLGAVRILPADRRPRRRPLLPGRHERRAQQGVGALPQGDRGPHPELLAGIAAALPVAAEHRDLIS